MYTCFIILLSQKLSISACTFHTVTFYKLFVLFGLRLAFLFFFSKFFKTRFKAPKTVEVKVTKEAFAVEEKFSRAQLILKRIKVCC